MHYWIVSDVCEVRSTVCRLVSGVCVSSVRIGLSLMQNEVLVRQYLQVGGGVGVGCVCVGVCVCVCVCVSVSMLQLLVHVFCVVHIFLTQRRIRFVYGVFIPCSIGNIMRVGLVGAKGH